MFISFEGTEGVGKTTLIAAITQYLRTNGTDVVNTREPGGTPFAESIRGLLLIPCDEPIAVDCELLLLFAARAQHIQQVITPALAQGKWVLCDRYVDASFAYQSGGRGIDAHKISTLVAQFVPVMPTLTFWLDAPVEIGLARATARGALDRFEQEKVTFFEGVRAAYARRAAAEPARIIRLDATLSPDALLQLVVDVLAKS